MKRLFFVLSKGLVDTDTLVPRDLVPSFYPKEYILTRTAKLHLFVLFIGLDIDT